MSEIKLLKKAKPILFNTEMVRAILEDRKTVTRRVVKLPKWIEKQNDGLYTLFAEGMCYENKHFLDIATYLNKPYRPGDILYVRETWCWCPCWDCGMDTEKGCCDKTAEKIYHQNYHEYGCYGYRASFGDNEQPFDKWHPSIHMPKEAARIFLKVTSVKVERLQDILKSPPGPNNQVVREGCTYGCDFIAVWESTIEKLEKDVYGWDTNPWVWVIEFERIKQEKAGGKSGSST